MDLSQKLITRKCTCKPYDIPQSYELEIRVVGAPNIPVMEFTSGGTSRSRTVQNLAGGTQYQFTIRPIYEDGIAGTDVSAVDSTRETGMWYVTMWNVNVEVCANTYLCTVCVTFLTDALSFIVKIHCS